jgi:predicted amidohydrolase
MHEAKSSAADIIHFSENALSGYAGIDYDDLSDVDEKELEAAFKDIQSKAKDYELSVIIGSHHFKDKNQKPFISLYVINKNGDILCRYDKRFLFGKRDEHDHLYYQAGTKAVQFELNGFKCGLLICHEWRYPELYREQKRLGTEILFQSWYDCSLSKMQYDAEGKHNGELILGAIKSTAANNHFWISASNTSREESSFPSSVIQADGRVKNQAERNKCSLIITTVDSTTIFEDPSGDWRQHALNNILNNSQSK